MSAAEPFEQEREQLEEEAVVWIVRLTSGGATDADRDALAVWRRRSPEHDQAFRKVERLWAGIQPLKARLSAAEAASERTGAPVAATATAGTRRIRQPVWIRWGAIAASLAALAVTLALASGTFPLLWADARTGVGEQRTLPLDDGSEILLNTQAAISIHYSEQARLVDLLAGEAAFRVEKDAGRPFLVQTNEGQVRAVGTEFIVHKTAEAVLVTVTEGVVEVSVKGGLAASPTLVQAGQRIRYDPAGVGPVEPVDLRVATAWQRGKLIFEATPLTLVVDEMNRYRRGHIMVLNPKLAEHRVSGVFDLQRLDAAVSTIERTLPITATHFTDRLIFFR